MARARILTAKPGLFRTILLRTLMAFALIVTTYNPSGYSFLSYIWSQLGNEAIFQYPIVKLLSGLTLILLWWLFIRSALKAMKLVPAMLMISILFILGYVTIDLIQGVGYAVGGPATIWIVELIMAIMLGVGISTGFINRKWSGTQQVDDVDAHVHEH